MDRSYWQSSQAPALGHLMLHHTSDPLLSWTSLLHSQVWPTLLVAILICYRAHGEVPSLGEKCPVNKTLPVYCPLRLIEAA